MEAKTGEKKKRVHLTVKQKLELIEKLESGVSVAAICNEYGVKKQTVSDIRKAKADLQKYSLSFDVESTSRYAKGGPRKHMKPAKEVGLDEAVMKWYVQQRSCGINIRGVEIQSAADTMAKHMNIEFKASDGWLWRFSKRHGIVNRRTFGEALSAPTEEIEPFRKKLLQIIKEDDLSLSQVYNADETGLFWRSIPENTKAFKHEKSIPGRKLSKERISALLCATADGLHRLTPVIVGKSRRPRVLKDIMNELPVIYCNSKKAWFTSVIFSDWFFNHFVSAVRKYQIETLKISSENVKALLLLDNAPSHPSDEILRTKDGKFKCLFLPKNTTSIIQPMDQGIILATKRLYRKRFLNEVMVVLEDEEDKEKDTRGERTLKNLKNYNLKSAIFNFASAFKAVSVSTLANGWVKLLRDMDVELQFQGFEVADYKSTMTKAGEVETTDQDISDWLEQDEGDPGYQTLSEIQIAEEVMTAKTEEDSEDEEEPPAKKMKLSEVRMHLDEVIAYIDSCDDVEMQPYYPHLRTLREIVIRKQHMTKTQTKLDAFFKPCT